MSFDYQVCCLFDKECKFGKQNVKKITRLLFEMYLWLPAIAKVNTQGILNNTSNEYNNLCINNRKE